MKKYKLTDNTIDNQDYLKMINFLKKRSYLNQSIITKKFEKKFSSFLGTKYSIFATPKVENNQWKDQARRISILGTSNWDSEELCYPFAFSYNDQEFLLYSGNGYGRSGLGIAILCN